MPFDNRALAQRILDSWWNRGDFASVEAFFEPGFRAHDSLSGERDRDGLKRDVQAYRASCPDLSVSCDDVVVEGDKVVIRWTSTGTHRGAPLLGAAATGERIRVEGMSEFRFANGRLAELWTRWDTLGLYRQLGLVSEARPPGAWVPSSTSA